MNQPLSPDDMCGLCNTTRENHGDKNHVFDIDGMLQPTNPPKSPSSIPPTPRSSNPLQHDPVARLNLRMVERMVAKGLFDGEDLLYIFGGEDASSRGNSPKSTG